MTTRVPMRRNPKTRKEAAVEEEVQVEGRAVEEDKPIKNGADGNTKQQIQ